MDKPTWAIFEWRGDGRYHLRDAIGARVYYHEKTADLTCKRINDEIAFNDAGGFVVRSSNYFKTNGVIISGNRVRLAELMGFFQQPAEEEKK